MKIAPVPRVTQFSAGRVADGFHTETVVALQEK